MNARVAVDLRAEPVLKIDIERREVEVYPAPIAPYWSLTIEGEAMDVTLRLTEGQADALRRVLVAKLDGPCCCPGCRAPSVETGADGGTRYCAEHWRQKIHEGEE